MYPLIRPSYLPISLPFGQLAREQPRAHVQPPTREKTMGDVLEDAARKQDERRFTGEPITDFGDSL